MDTVKTLTTKDITTVLQFPKKRGGFNIVRLEGVLLQLPVLGNREAIKDVFGPDFISFGSKKPKNYFARMKSTAYDNKQNRLEVTYVLDELF